MKVPSVLVRIQEAVGKHAQLYLVGGCVRDMIINPNIVPKDIDVEVFGIEYENLVSILNRFGKVDEVGKSFGVIKLKHENIEYDFSIPRTESKDGVGHKGFDVKSNSKLSLEDAALRRDLTINAIYMNVYGTIVDPYDGKLSITYKLLHPVSDKFGEDVLRVLRIFQFASRFDMKASDKLIYYSMLLRDEYDSLPKERIYNEWEKWALKSIKPSAGLKFLDQCGWINLYPEIEKMKYVMQDELWHPEGSVYNHTLYVCDHMAHVCDRDNIVGEDRVVLMFAALCHDMGKVTHTQFKDNGRISSKGHEAASVPFVVSFLESINCPKNIIKRVIPLVKEHMLCHLKLSDRAVRKLSFRLQPECIDNLVRLGESDQCGRPPLPKVINENLLETHKRSKELGVNKKPPKPLVNGADLMEHSFVQGEELGRVLDKLYQMQLKGSFSSKEQGIKLSKGI